MNKARKQLQKPVLDNYRLYKIAGEYPGELQIIVHSWGSGYRKNIKKYFSKLSGMKLAINGEDLKNLGYKPSSKFKKVLGKVLALRLNGEISSREKQLHKAKELMESIK